MSCDHNRRILFVQRPLGLPEASCFHMEEGSIPQPGAGEVLIELRYLSVDPYLRGRMNPGPSYIDPFVPGEPLVSGGVGVVVSSNHSRLAQGDWVTGMLPWQDYATAAGDHLAKLDPQQAPVTTALGILGMPGLTAYFGLLDIGRPRAGETVVISAAAGAVGSAAGQIAKIHGCRVVGIAGGPEKTAALLSLGFDAAIDYKDKAGFDAALAAACPDGVNIYFDNVGGPISDAVTMKLALRARVVICGQIALYNLKRPALGPRNLFILLVRRARMEGFIVTDYAARYEEGLTALRRWLGEGRLTCRETIREGLENAPAVFLELFQGTHHGKLLVKVK